jgi:SAM-dependent methyltransferase
MSAEAESMGERLWTKPAEPDVICSRCLNAGLDVHGADISPDALEFARKAALAHGLESTLYHQRMEECSLPHRYGTIYVANGTFEIITDRNQTHAVLRRFLQHLVPGGQLLLELSVPPRVTRGQPAMMPIIRRAGDRFRAGGRQGK